ncbi:hypothetical protein C8R45DRAFT_1103288 [Mycena sanguinolenta]|nr:hypothetical protein C8R45DRAFT_1103288 [Mycena sanguinolenta]
MHLSPGPPHISPREESPHITPGPEDLRTSPCPQKPAPSASSKEQSEDNQFDSDKEVAADELGSDKEQDVDELGSDKEQDVDELGSDKEQDVDKLGSDKEQDIVEPDIDHPDDDEEWHGISGDPNIEKPVAKNPIPRLRDSDDDEDALLPDVTGLTTWAKRNPGKHILRSKSRAKRVIGPEQHRTLHDRAKTKKDRMAALNQDIALLNQSRSEMVQELSTKHKFKTKLVKERLLASTTFKSQRKPSLFRAKIHHLSKVLNEGLAVSERLSLHDVRKRVKTHPLFRNMSSDFKAQLLNDLMEHRSIKKTGTRATNKAVAQDASYVVKRLNSEIQGLHDRCGMYGFAILSKGHVQDKTIPWILQSASSADFIREVLKIDPMDLIAKFEQWCFTGVDTLVSMRKEVTGTIKAGLVIACKRKKCAMNYERYIKAVVLGYGVMIVGWPKQIDFTSPTNISSVDDMRKLRDTWKDGTARWKMLSKSEKEKWRKDYEEKVESGEIVEVERQRRSDKGIIRGQNSRTAGKREAANKSKTRNKKIVEEEEENDEEGDEEGDEEEEEDNYT